MDILVSVIVPVYKVESHIRKCIYSIMHQTYKNLEIILIDDGSPDLCGEICDEMAAKDTRIRVVHQKNKGLSEARNQGIKICRGMYILFVDGDDYIESKTIECLLQASLDTSADVSCCGYIKETKNESIAHILTETKKHYDDNEKIVIAMMNGELSLRVWDKLWKRELFDTGVFFPPGRNFEDISTTWRLLIKSHRIVCVPDILFHYVVRDDSITRTKTMKNLIDRWTAFKERYDEMALKSNAFYLICTNDCLETIGYIWRWLYGVDKEERFEYEKVLCEMKLFLEDHKALIRGCPMTTRFSLFCARHSNEALVFICYYINQFYRCCKQFGHGLFLAIE